MAFFGCLIGTFIGNALWSYIHDKFSRIMFNYKCEEEIKRSWLE